MKLANMLVVHEGVTSLYASSMTNLNDYSIMVRTRNWQMAGNSVICVVL